MREEKKKYSEEKEKEEKKKKDKKEKKKRREKSKFLREMEARPDRNRLSIKKKEKRKSLHILAVLTGVFHTNER